MSDIYKLALSGVRSLARRVKERALRDVILDARDGKEWAKNYIPSIIFLLVEKWLGFWYTFLFAMGVGWAGWMLVESAQLASDVPIVTNKALWAISHVGTLGFILVLLSGIGILGIVTVSVTRLLLWLRDISKEYWKKHTPRHAERGSESDIAWPPSEEEIDRARSKLWKFVSIGAILFLTITPTLVWLEANYPNQLQAVVSNPRLSSIGDVVTAAIWVINIEGLFGTVSASVSQAWIIYFILIFVLPGIFIAIAARNLLFIAEAFVRTEIEEVTEGSILSWTSVKLIGLVLLFSLWAVGIGLEIFTGL